jgi:hypothetical protein
MAFRRRLEAAAEDVFSLLPHTTSQGIKNDRFAPAWKN